MTRALAIALLLSLAGCYTGHASPETLAALDAARAACTGGPCWDMKALERQAAFEAQLDRVTQAATAGGGIQAGSGADFLAVQNYRSFRSQVGGSYHH